MFAALRKAFAPANVTPGLRTLDRCAAGAGLVRSVALLVREANGRAKDLVIRRESEVGTSLDVIHSIVTSLNSDSSRRGHQKTHPFSIRHSLSAMDVREEDGRTIIPQGMDRSVKLGHELRAKLNSFCILNTQVMRSWVDRYNAVRVSMEIERAQIHRGLVDVHHYRATSLSSRRQSQLMGACRDG
jgi:hypothetical protein